MSQPAVIPDKHITVIGVDLGWKGAMAVLPDPRTGLLPECLYMPVIRTLDKKGRTQTAYDMRAVHAKFLHWIETYGSGSRWDTQIVVAIERQWGRPGEAFNRIGHLIEGHGMFLCLADVLDLPRVGVIPSVWRPAMVGAGTDKNASRMKAKALWPDLDWKLVKSEALAEAALIANYVFRTLTGDKPKLPPRRRVKRNRNPEVTAVEEVDKKRKKRKRRGEAAEEDFNLMSLREFIALDNDSEPIAE